ncbi:DNA glycosylase [Saccharata proteae CBS 121410]|uniref:DNA glycosylase n=1 Tax=Saccharata proteae CBS 121410 TaxID=1314787 RepID=A0A9P4HTG7_9PEZI|nr:DNA glycosylase [Saccharata proteae CBS 121410]
MSLRRSTRISSLPAHAAAKATAESEKTATTRKPGAAQAAKKRKASTAAPIAREPSIRTQHDPAVPSEPPSTPPPPPPPATKRRRGPKAAASPGTAAPPPETPTPAAIGLMTSSPPVALNGDGDGNDATVRHLARPAGPHATNATLQTPGGSRLSAYAVDVSPSKGAAAVPRPTTTTGNLLAEAEAHLIRVDPSLRKVVEKHKCKVFSPEGLMEDVDPFRSLVSGILAQQVSHLCAHGCVSGAAAKSIKNKFIALFPSTDPGYSFPTPAQVAVAEISLLRSAGLSGRKAEYVKGLAEMFVSGDLSAQMLVQASDEEVMEKLTAVRGLGRWSVEMFACFGLKRMDVFSTGDLGVQRGMAAYMGRDVSKLKAKGGGKWKYMSEKDMLEHSAPFAPYRSLFMWYMWRIEDVDVDALG